MPPILIGLRLMVVSTSHQCILKGTILKVLISFNARLLQEALDIFVSKTLFLAIVLPLP